MTDKEYVKENHNRVIEELSEEIIELQCQKDMLIEDIKIIDKDTNSEYELKEIKSWVDFYKHEEGY